MNDDQRFISESIDVALAFLKDFIDTKNQHDAPLPERERFLSSHRARSIMVALLDAKKRIDSPSPGERPDQLSP